MIVIVTVDRCPNKNIIVALVSFTIKTSKKISASVQHNAIFTTTYVGMTVRLLSVSFYITCNTNISLILDQK